MAFIIKPLAIGNITSVGDTALYVVPDAKSAMITSVRLVNNGGYSSSVSLRAQPSGGTARLIAAIGSALPISGMVLMEDAVTLGKLDQIKVTVSGTSPNIDYLVSGLERD